MNAKRLLALNLAPFVLAACGNSDDSSANSATAALSPDSAPQVPVDRFSHAACMLMKRSDSPALAGPNMLIDFDQGALFIARGLGPQGNSRLYYNFDLQPATPAPTYVLFREGEESPVADQLNLIDVIPGNPGYNDFGQVVRVTVPSDYVANGSTVKTQA